MRGATAGAFLCGSGERGRMGSRKAPLLLGTGGLLVGGATVLVAGTLADTGGFDAVLAAYGLFVAGFCLGAVYQYRRGHEVGAAGHAVAVLGWLAGIGGRTTGDLRLVAFSLAALGASGIALLYVGVDTVSAGEGNVELQ